MKLVNPEQTKHYIDKLADVLDGKSNATHRHARVNGLKVVVTDTAPTVDDESVLTLVVDTAHVPDVGGLTAEFAGNYSKLFSYNAFVPFFESHFTVQAYLDDEPVEAQYQVEEAGKTVEVLVPYSSNNTFDLLTLIGFDARKIRVKYGDYEKVFSIDLVGPEVETRVARIPNIDFSDSSKTSGFFKLSGEEISGAITYEEASEGMRLIWRFQDGVNGSDFSTVTVERAVGVIDLDHIPLEMNSFLEAFEKEPRGLATITSSEIYFDINETFTEDDISIGAAYLMSATASDGSEYYSLFTQGIKDLPSTEHFSSHVTRCAFNQDWTTKDEADNAMTKTSSSNGSFCYFYFETDVEFAYDIEIRLTDNSETPLASSTKVPFYRCDEVITLKAGTKSTYKSCYHKLATAGTYYVVANITGVSTDYEQSRVIELTVT